MTEGFVLIRRTDAGWEFEYGGEIGVDDEGFLTAGRWYGSTIADAADGAAFSVVIQTRDGKRWRVGVQEAE